MLKRQDYIGTSEGNEWVFYKHLGGCVISQMNIIMIELRNNS